MLSDDSSSDSDSAARFKGSRSSKRDKNSSKARQNEGDRHEKSRPLGSSRDRRSRDRSRDRDRRRSRERDRRRSVDRTRDCDRRRSTDRPTRDHRGSSRDTDVKNTKTNQDDNKNKESLKKEIVKKDEPKNDKVEKKPSKETAKDEKVQRSNSRSEKSPMRQDSSKVAKDNRQVSPRHSGKDESMPEKHIVKPVEKSEIRSPHIVRQDSKGSVDRNVKEIRDSKSACKPVFSRQDSRHDVGDRRVGGGSREGDRPNERFLSNRDEMSDRDRHRYKEEHNRDIDRHRQDFDRNKRFEDNHRDRNRHEQEYGRDRIHQEHSRERDRREENYDRDRNRQNDNRIRQHEDRQINDRNRFEDKHRRERMEEAFDIGRNRQEYDRNRRDRDEHDRRIDQHYDYKQNREHESIGRHEYRDLDRQASKDERMRDSMFDRDSHRNIERVREEDRHSEERRRHNSEHLKHIEEHNVRESDHRKHDKRRFSEEPNEKIVESKNGRNVKPTTKDAVKRGGEFRDQGVKEKKAKRSMSPISSEEEEIPKQEEVTETIHLSDSSEDEAALQRKLLLLERELKKTKKKSKHKDKKSKKKKSKSSSDETTSDASKKLIKNNIDINLTVVSDPSGQHQRVVSKHPNNIDKKSPVKVINRKEYESNEEGEILSDSDDLHDPKDARKKAKGAVDSNNALPDLRQKLSKNGGSSICGPALPPHMKNRDSSVEVLGVEGPALPPHLSKKGETKVLGPSLSSEMRERLAQEQSESEDEDAIGPLPSRPEKGMSETQRRLEERALEIKMAGLDHDKEVKADRREEWMLELPEAKAKILGLGPRSFRAKAGPDMSDRSSWTDTPVEKALKAAGVVLDSEDKMKERMSQDAEMQYVEERDREQDQAAKAHKKKHKRDKSLLELHQKKIEKKNKKDKESGLGEERRPFSREVDLKVNRFDEAQKKAIMKRAGQLDDKFSSGQAKYL